MEGSVKMKVGYTKKTGKVMPWFNKLNEKHSTINQWVSSSLEIFEDVLNLPQFLKLVLHQLFML